MFTGFNLKRTALLFILRNLALYLLLINAFLHFKGELRLLFLSATFILALLLALWLEIARLRFLPSLLLVLFIPVLLRGLFFMVFGALQALSAGLEADLNFFYFDNDFFAALIPFFMVWLFNFLSLRYHLFTALEVALNALLLMVIFWSEANYRISLYPHPSFFAYFLLLFIFLEILVLVLSKKGGERVITAPIERSLTTELKSFLSFAWLLIPLLLILLFFILGRYSEGAVRAGGGLMKPTLFRFDFSQFIRLESDIKLSEDLVMLFRKEGPAQRLLLRRFILSGYDPGRGFYHLRKKGIEEFPVTVPDSVESFSDPGYLSRSEIEQEYFFINFDPTSLISINYPVKVMPLQNWESSSFLRIYRVLSRSSEAMPFELEEGDHENLPDPVHGFYTEYGDDEKIAGLAREITAGEDNYYRRVMLIRDYLKNNYFYSLKPGLSEEGNQLHHFLFNSQKGYCSYFAFAMALLCRSIGIPARVAVGFYVDPAQEVLNFYEIRAFQAHAWSEVYFGNYGWIEIDATSEEIAPGEEFSFSFGFDINNFSRLIEEILNHQDELKVEEADGLELGERVYGLGRQIGAGIAFLARLWYITLPLLYLLFICTVKLYLLVFFAAASKERDKIKHLFRFSLIMPYGLGLIRSPEESNLEYAERMKREHGLQLTDWCACYLKAAFGREFSNSEFSNGLAAYRSFINSYRRRYALYLRVLGFLNPINTLRSRG